MSMVAPSQGVNPNQCFNGAGWSATARSPQVELAKQSYPSPSSPAHSARSRVARLLGKKTLEAEILKEAVEIAREQKLMVRSPLLLKRSVPFQCCD